MVSISRASFWFLFGFVRINTHITGRGLSDISGAKTDVNPSLLFNRQLSNRKSRTVRSQTIIAHRNASGYNGNNATRHIDLFDEFKNFNMHSLDLTYPTSVKTPCTPWRHWTKNARLPTEPIIIATFPDAHARLRHCQIAEVRRAPHNH